MATGNPYLKGKILIASPAIGDPRFDKAVIFVCDHSDEHAMGIPLNKPVREASCCTRANMGPVTPPCPSPMILP